MKLPSTIFFIFLFFFSSCQKNSPRKIDEVKYEVTLIHSSTWSGAYLNENGQVVGVEYEKSGWQYTFKNTNHLVAAQIDAYADDIYSDSDADIKIYINGVVVAETLSSSSPQALYEFP